MPCFYAEHPYPGEGYLVQTNSGPVSVYGEISTTKTLHRRKPALKKAHSSWLAHQTGTLHHSGHHYLALTHFAFRFVT